MQTQLVLITPLDRFEWWFLRTSFIAVYRNLCNNSRRWPSGGQKVGQNGCVKLNGYKSVEWCCDPTAGGLELSPWTHRGRAGHGSSRCAWGLAHDVLCMQVGYAITNTDTHTQAHTHTHILEHTHTGLSEREVYATTTYPVSVARGLDLNHEAQTFSQPVLNPLLPSGGGSQGGGVECSTEWAGDDVEWRRILNTNFIIRSTQLFSNLVATALAEGGAGGQSAKRMSSGRAGRHCRLPPASTPPLLASPSSHPFWNANKMLQFQLRAAN